MATAVVNTERRKSRTHWRNPGERARPLASGPRWACIHGGRRH